MATEDDVLRILIASDTHLGYGEKDPIRGDDSFVTFAEVFEIANREQVDMVLLAGDLFHDNKPSRRTMHKCMEILRDHCLGSRKVQIEVVSDQQANFHGKYQTVNFEDPNYNVQLPVFSIHGNHDDPAGDGGLAALDILSTANLINYFGRAGNFEKIALAPVSATCATSGSRAASSARTSRWRVRSSSATSGSPSWRCTRTGCHVAPA
jgi:double-strand break repair protein MRE11